MARYLITGIAGFVGSSIARALVLRGDQVSGIDNLSTGSLSNLYPLAHAMRIYKGDIRDEALLERACGGVDFIFHEAAIASVQKSLESPTETNDVNYKATLRLIEAARANGVRRFIFASSAAVYGTASALPLAEGTKVNPLSPYAAQKFACEEALEHAWKAYRMETVSLRYFNVYGPRQSSTSEYSGLIARLTRLMLVPEPKARPVIYGDGEQSRDFVYIDDVVTANLAAAAAPSHTVAGKVFNIASGLAYSVNQIAEIIAERVGYELGVTHVQAREGEVRKSLADIQLARTKLKYSPTTDITQGLAKTVDWYRRQIAGMAQNGRGPAPTSIDALRRREREGLVEDLTEAVACGNFHMAFQPIVSLKNGRITGAEALLRWQNRGKNIPAGRFIPLAEEAGLIHKLGEWAIRHSCSIMGPLIAAVGDDFRLAVNISPSELESETLCQTIHAALRQGKMSARNFELEITERVCIHNWAKVGKTLDAIHATGVSIALDDFGAGYSNMESLCRLKLKRIKIDRSITVASRVQVPVFDGIVAMAEKLAIPVVVEGVETLKQFERAKAAGCDEAQGFFIAKPASASDLMRLVEESRATM